MDGFYHLKFEDLQRLRDEREEESLTLEFKPCNELKVGSKFRDKTGQQRVRERDDVLNELTKDVTAFLNSAGGMIIYGIQEKNSRADEIDKTNSFKLGSKQDNIQSEKVIDWLRAHIQPPPAVDVYRVLETPGDPASSWYLVIEVPQGQQAYMARDHRFYKRVSNTVQPMEQYEVKDVMNRAMIPDVDLKFKVTTYYEPPDDTCLFLKTIIKNQSMKVVNDYKLKVKITNVGFLDDLFEGEPQVLKGHITPEKRENVTWELVQRQYGSHNFDLLITYRSKGVLFPDEELDISSELGWGHKRYEPLDDSITPWIDFAKKQGWFLEWVLYADNMSSKKGEAPIYELEGF